MIEEWPGISTARSASLRRVESFLTARGLPPDAYGYVMTVPPPATARYVVTYGLDDDEGLNAIFAAGGLRVRVSGQVGLSLLCVIAFDPSIRQSLTTLRSGLALPQALAAVGGNAGSHEKPKIGQWGVGVWIAPDKDAFVVFEVDWRGNVEVIGRGDAAGAAFLLAAMLCDRASAVRRQADEFAALPRAKPL